MQIRCIDAAREAARLVARGTSGDRRAAGRAAGATLQLRRDGEFVVAHVSAQLSAAAWSHDLRAGDYRGGAGTG